MGPWARVAFTLCIFLVSTSQAWASALRVGAIGGIAFASSEDTGKYAEGPIGTEFFADYSTTSRFVIGGKHLRSWTTGLGSSIGSTMLTVKYYVNNDIPSGYEESEDIVASTFEKRSHAFYLGLSVGFLQSSVQASSSGLSATAVGIAGGGTAGFDWQIMESAGLRVNGSFELTFVGVGQVTIIFGGAGFYLNF